MSKVFSQYGSNKDVVTAKVSTVNEGTFPLNRIGGVSKHFINNFSTTITLTIDSSQYLDGDIVEIHKTYENGSITLTSNPAPMYISDGTFDTTHTLAAGYAVIIQLFYFGGNWHLTMK